MTDWEPHPEGGSYRRVWTSELTLPAGALPDGYDGDRAAGTCIGYRLVPGERSRWHRVRSTELWLWQGGGELVLTLGGTGERPATARTVVLGAERALQHVVAPGEWQSAEPAGATAVTVACVVVPGFAWDDWEVEPDRQD